MADSTFENALQAAIEEFVRLQKRDDELGRQMEMNQAEIQRYGGVIMALEQLLGRTSARNATAHGRTSETLHEYFGVDRHAAEAPTQTAQIVKLLRRYPSGLERSALELLMKRESVVPPDVNDWPAAANTALWRAVKSGQVERDGDTYRVPRPGASSGPNTQRSTSAQRSAATGRFVDDSGRATSGRIDARKRAEETDA